MNSFELITPTSLAHASTLLKDGGRIAIAGGVDVVDLLKLNLIAPAAIVDLGGLKELQGIQPRPDGGLRIGALTRLAEVGEHPQIRERFTAVSMAASEVATPQIRNLGTIGGNLLQRPRCWYFRNPDIQCLKKGGERCYALGGLNRYHSILGGGPSFIVHPSSLAPALIALGGSARIVGPQGERTVALEKFFALPAANPAVENTLKPGEVIVEINLPAPPRGARSVYLEVREKQSFDWALVSVAAMLAMGPGSTAQDARIVMGAVAPIPWRSPEAEAILKGGALDRKRADLAAEAALKQAQPMSDNAYKVTIAKVLIRRATLRGAGIEAA